MAARTVDEVYRFTKKTPDLPWNEYVCRPLAAPIVLALSKTSVTPNQVTLASLLVAVVSMVLLVGAPGDAGLVVAAVVFEASYVLDCADGMLARLRNVQSTPGHLFDFLMDEIKAFGILGACSVRLFFYRNEDSGFLIAGIFGLVVLATGIALTTFVRRPEIAPPAATAWGAKSRPSIVSLFERAAKLVIHYPSYFLFVAISGRLEIYFFPYIAVNALYAAMTLASVALRFGRG